MFQSMNNPNFRNRIILPRPRKLFQIMNYITFRIIVENAGKSAEGLLAVMMTSYDKEIGFDANNDKFVNMKKSGIIDPTMVTRLALENALSVASNLLMTEAAISMADDIDMNFPPGM